MRIPIDHHVLLSDQKSLALLDPFGSVVWLCAPRPDAPPVFGSLLDDDAGVFSIVPLDGKRLGQSYDGDTMICRTSYQGIDVVDFLDVTCAEGTRLVRRIQGKGTVLLRFAPRLDFGAVATRFTADEHGLHIDGGLPAADGAPCPITLTSSAPIAFEFDDDGTHHEVSAAIDVDGVVVLELLIGADVADDDEVTRRRTTARFWAQWVKQLQLPDVEHGALRDVIARSALVLKALVYAPTGAMVAAATTSLPETFGGLRNWDYRYCWPRDASFAAATLARLGDTDVGVQLLRWIADRSADLHRTGAGAGMLEPLYAVTGEPLDGEVLRDDVKGYGGSQPVRVGNGAAGQVQLDAFGPVVELAATLHDAGVDLDDDLVDFVETLLQAIADGWDRPGHGVWELRARERSHVYSRGMCWWALTRGSEVLAARDVDVDVFRSAAHAIQNQTAAEGFFDAKQAYTMAYGEPDLDAAVLKLIGSGFFDDVDKERSTVAAIADELQAGPTVFRYLMDDGLEGEEGGFFLCAFWLADALARTGDVDGARRLFVDVVKQAGPLGLMAEEHDPRPGTVCKTLGNFPQAYSHLGLLDSAMLLARLETAQ